MPHKWKGQYDLDNSLLPVVYLCARAVPLFLFSSSLCALLTPGIKRFMPSVSGSIREAVCIRCWLLFEVRTTLPRLVRMFYRSVEET